MGKSKKEKSKKDKKSNQEIDYRDFHKNDGFYSDVRLYKTPIPWDKL